MEHPGALRAEGALFFCFFYLPEEEMDQFLYMGTDKVTFQVNAMSGLHDAPLRPVVMLAALCVLTTAFGTFFSVSADTEPNDTFDNPEDIVFTNDPITGSLTVADPEDVYRFMGLIGDNDDDQLKCQKLSVSLFSTGGANVRGTLYEPYGETLPLATLVSSGERSEVELMVPYDGDYYFKVVSDPAGQSATYRIELAGAFDVNNQLYYDGNNEPGMVGFSGSRTFSDTLSPLYDVVDCYHVDLQPETSLQASFYSEKDYRMEVLNSTFASFAELGPDENYTVKNDGSVTMRIMVRVHYPLVGGTLYIPSPITYLMRIEVWSHTTIPQVNPSDPWTSGRSILEDVPLSPHLNLTKHFQEPRGDPVSIELLSTPEHLSVDVVNVMDPDNDEEVLFVEARISPLLNWNGEETLLFRCSDKDGSVTDTLTITVVPVNDLPYITRFGGAEYHGGIFNMLGLEDEVRTYYVEYGDDDDPAPSLFFTTNETLPFVEMAPNNGTIRVHPAEKDIGFYWFNVTLVDGTGGYTIVDIKLGVEGVNDPPPTPVITMRKGNASSIFPGEEVEFEAVMAINTEEELLTFTWDFGDGKTGKGAIVSHIFKSGVYGTRTVSVVVSDGRLKSNDTLLVFLKSPEDLAVGNLEKVFTDHEEDVVMVQEEWKLSEPNARVETLSKTADPGVDILSLSCIRDGNNLVVRLTVRDSVFMDGSFRYHVYVVPPDFTEEPALLSNEPFKNATWDFRNTSGFWSLVIDRSPQAPAIASRHYLGDPSINNGSQGTIFEQSTLVFVIPFMEMAAGGMSLPIRPENFSIFAVVEHRVKYEERTGLATSYNMTDTSGKGALLIGDIASHSNTTGGGTNPFGDFATVTNLVVVLTLLVAALVLGIIGFFLVRKQKKEKEREEAEFIKKVEAMRAEGKDLFGKEKEQTAAKAVSYEDLYGKPPPPDFKPQPSAAPAPSLPGPGLGMPQEAQSNIVELKMEKGPSSEPPSSAKE